MKFQTIDISFWLATNLFIYLQFIVLLLFRLSSPNIVQNEKIVFVLTVIGFCAGVFAKCQGFL